MTILKDSRTYRLAETLLVLSPGDPGYVRGLADLVASATGIDFDQVHGALIDFNRRQSPKEIYLIRSSEGWLGSDGMWRRDVRLAEVHDRIDGELVTLSGYAEWVRFEEVPF